MTAGSRRDRIIAAAVAGAALAVPACLLVLSGADAGRAAWDAGLYHERVIRAFIERFPAIDVSNPLTTTTPGYHVALAAFGAAISDAPIALRLAAVAVGTSFVAFVAAWCAGLRGAAQGTLLALPLACSLYVVGSAAWPLPDDAAWLLVAATLAACLRVPVTPGRAATICLSLLALVLVRQVHLWAALPAVVACAWPSDAGQARSRGRRVLAATAAVAPAFGAVAAFAVTWGGLVPPRFQSDVTGINPATPAFVLLQFAVAGIAFLPWLGPSIADAWGRRRGALVAAAAVGLALAAFPATSTDASAGRSSGWWNALASVPALAGRTNPAMLLRAPAGAVLLASALGRLAPRTRAVLGAAVVGFVAAVTATHYSWQRYHEPFVLLFLAMLSALQPAPSGERPSPRPAMLLTAGALCALLWSITWRGLAGEPVDRGQQPAPEHLMPGERFPAMPAVQSKTDPIASATGGQ